MHANHKTPSNLLIHTCIVLYRVFIASFRHSKNMNENTKRKKLLEMPQKWILVDIRWPKTITHFTISFGWVFCSHLALISIHTHTIIVYTQTITHLMEKIRRKKVFSFQKLLGFIRSNYRTLRNLMQLLLLLLLSAGSVVFCSFLLSSLSLNERKTMREKST